jgi:hypothetical protein
MWLSEENVGGNQLHPVNRKWLINIMKMSKRKYRPKKCNGLKAVAKISYGNAIGGNGQQRNQ